MPADSPLQDLQLVLVGPGRVGWSLVRWAVDRGASLGGVVGRSRRRAAEQATLSLDDRWCALAEFSTPRWRRLDGAPGLRTVLLLAVADGALEPLARELAGRLGDGGDLDGGDLDGGDLDGGDLDDDRATSIALHTSGIHDASALGPLARVGFAVGSLHPLKAFARSLPEPGPQPPLFAVDGEGSALETARRMARAFGGRAFEIAGRRRLLYHLAATVAAGGVATLMAVVEDLLARADLPPDLLPSYFGLADGALEAALGAAQAGRGVDDAITGPAARGDVDTVERQLEALRGIAPELVAPIEAVHRETLRRSGRAIDRPHDGPHGGPPGGPLGGPRRR